jgi:hypothetical protein
MFKTKCALAVSAAIFSTSAHAASIATLFAKNNGGSDGGAVYFDITTGPNPVTITGLFTNTDSAAGITFTDFKVWLLPGTTFVGNESSPLLWQLAATGSGTTAATNSPTEVFLSNPISLTANTLYGIVLQASPEHDFAYTNGNGSNQVYSNADLTLTLGKASNTPFTGSFISPRVWNGELTYTTSGVPEPSGTVTMTSAIMAAVMMKRRRRA